MTRRDTIISAALINAGLLVILFVCALGVDETIDSKAAQASFVPTIQTIPEVQPTEQLVQEISLVASATDSREVIIQKGDRLDLLAKQYGVTPEAIVEANRLSSTQLVVGQKLQIPHPRGAFIADAQPVVMSEPLSPVEPAPIKSTPPAKPARSKALASAKNSSTDPSAQYHYVQKGESPWHIAKKYGISVDKLMKLNHLDEATARRLREGDRLRVR